MKPLLFLSVLIVLLLVACTPSTPSAPQNLGDATVMYETFGGFSLPERAKEELMIEDGHAVYRIISYDDEVTVEYESDLTPGQMGRLDTLLANFDSLEERYSAPPEGPIIADAPTTRFTVEQEGRVRVVTVDGDTLMPAEVRPYQDFMREIIQELLTLDQEGAEDLAREWFTTAPTYAFDGHQLEQTSYAVSAEVPVHHTITYRFATYNEGYGNREGQLLDGRITLHNAVVIVQEGRVVSAVIDGEWDEIGQRALLSQDVRLRFEPVQCVETPWERWYLDGNIRYIKEPTHIELITDYYGKVYGIGLEDIVQEERDGVVCQGCHECKQDVFFEATAADYDADVLVAEGWESI